MKRFKIRTDLIIFTALQSGASVGTFGDIDVNLRIQGTVAGAVSQISMPVENTIAFTVIDEFTEFSADVTMLVETLLP